MTPTDSKTHAQALLRLNPHVFAQQIVEQRARYMGLEKVPSTKAGADGELSQRRQTAQAALAKIRSDFWMVPLPQIESRLAALKVEGLPDLAASAARLTRIAQSSAEFLALYSERKINSRFVDALRLVVVLPPSEAGQIKQQREYTLCRGRDLRSARRTVRLIAKKYPQIYDLEREWLDHIASASRFVTPRLRSSGPSSGTMSRYHNWHWVSWIIVIVSILVRVLLHK